MTGKRQKKTGSVDPCYLEPLLRLKLAIPLEKIKDRKTSPFSILSRDKFETCFFLLHFVHRSSKI